MSQRLAVKVENNSLKFGSATISFQRTLRIPDDGKTYPLPPSFGHFPVHRIDDYMDKVPADWRAHGGVFIPMYQREAMWIQFEGKKNEPKACKVAIGKVNSISGKPWNQKFVKGVEQDYVVIPDQPWLDGINAGDGMIKQFVAMPLGGGYTVEAQVTGKEDVGGLQVIVFDPKPNRFQRPPSPVKPQPPPPPQPYHHHHHHHHHHHQHHPPQIQPAPAPAPPVMQPFSMVPASEGLFSMPPVSQNAPAFDSSAPMPRSADKSSKRKKAESASAPSMKQSQSQSQHYELSNESYYAPAPSSLFASSSAAAPSAMSFLGGQSYPLAPPPAAVQSGYAYPLEQPSAPVFEAPRRAVIAEPEAKEMGLAAGGKMKQSIYKDTLGIDTWDESNYARVFVHIVNSTMYRQITGKEPPGTPIDAAAYTNFGYPWFDVYDEHVPAVPKSGILSQVKSVSQIDKQKFGYAKQDNSTVNISGSQVHHIAKDQVRDGDW